MIALNYGELAKVIQVWGSYSRTVGRTETPSWAPVKRMRDAAIGLMADYRKELQSLLERSEARFTPLDEPLRTNLGLHRWLAIDREEAYSDWLRWIIEQLPHARYVELLFEIQLPAAVVASNSTCEVIREKVVPEGKKGHAGRLDLVIRYEGAALVVIEVKRFDADAAEVRKEFEKHEGYQKWIEDQPEPSDRKFKVLLATGGSRAEYDGFRLVTWAAICQRLRRIVVGLRDMSMTVAALILAFVGAVEQNLLGFSSAQIRAITGSDVHLSLFDSRVIAHLRASLENRPDDAVI